MNRTKNEVTNGPYIRVADTTSVLQSSTPEPLPMEATASRPDQDVAIVGALIGIIILLACLLLYLIVPPLWTRLRSLAPVSKKRVDSRYETIEGWLITKRVRAHDDECECRNKHAGDTTEQSTLKFASACNSKDTEDGQEFGTGSPAPPLQQTASYDTHETTESDYMEDKECPICMSAFKVNEIVSWSPNEQCNHVYHHECIKEWLLRHSDCPFCRHVFLTVDECTKQKLDRIRYKELCQQRTKRLHQTYFCDEAGLVCLPILKLLCANASGIEYEKDVEHGSKTVATWKQLLNAGVSKGDLAKLRGGRKEETCNADESQLHTQNVITSNETTPEVEHLCDSIEATTECQAASSIDEKGRAMEITCGAL
ncbi:hypothetical protein MPSEU_000932500 [Mayamaea pseudoterrestris]|nr:hypothetical protein MPSEU_000932500 [Mayamaea pseudoterrestris]